VAFLSKTGKLILYFLTYPLHSMGDIRTQSNPTNEPSPVLWLLFHPIRDPSLAAPLPFGLGTCWQKCAILKPQNIRTCLAKQDQAGSYMWLQ